MTEAKEELVWRFPTSAQFYAFCDDFSMDTTYTF
jgi:hypothetical protein